MASIRDQLNAYGRGQGYDSNNANEYADTPNAQRADDIVSEARRRLAEQGGKASMLPAMIQRVTNEFASRDQMAQGTTGGTDYRQPNNMENYIDRVLQMSGMTAGSSSARSRGGAVADDGGSDVPVPTARPSVEDDVDTGNGTEIVAMDGEEGMSFGQIAAALLGAGGLAGAAKYLYDRYGNRIPSVGGAMDAINQSLAAVDGVDPNADPSAADEDGAQRVITEEKRARLEGPRTQIEGPSKALPAPTPPSNLPAVRESAGLPVPASAVDEMINETMGQEDIDQVFQDRVEGRAGSQDMPGANRFNDEMDMRARVVEQASKLPPRDAIRLLRENGIELDDELLRSIAEGSNTARSLKQRAAEMAGGAVRKAVRP